MSGYATQRTHTKAAVDTRHTGDERFRVLGVGSLVLNLAPTPFTRLQDFTHL